MKYVFFLLFGIVFCLSFYSCNRESLDEKIKREADEFTIKNCPKEVDPYTVIDSTCFDLRTRTYTYNYTVSGVLDNDSIYTDELKETFGSKVLSELKNSIQMKGYKDAELNFVYRYRSDKSGKILLELKYKVEDYK